MAEWLKAHAWKACRRATVSRVRIPLSPPLTYLTLRNTRVFYSDFFCAVIFAVIFLFFKISNKFQHFKSFSLLLYVSVVTSSLNKLKALEVVSSRFWKFKNKPVKISGWNKFNSAWDEKSWSWWKSTWSKSIMVNCIFKRLFLSLELQFTSSN